MRQILVRKLNVNRLDADVESRKKSGRWAASVAVAALTVSAVFVFAERAYSTREEASSNVVRPETARTSTKPATPLAAAPTARVQTEIINILPDGFEPSQITRSHGRIFLLVEDHSGLREVSLQLDREAGSRLRDVQVPREKRGWSDLVDLTPGKYMLREANHSDWSCEITITP